MNITAIRDNVDLIEHEGRKFYIVGTAHVSQASVDLAESTIRDTRPNTVAIELCRARHEALQDSNRWRNTNIMTVIREGKTLLLLTQLMLAAFQRKLGRELNLKPGEEMMRASAVASELGAELTLADRDVKTTLKRTWAALGFWQKCKLIFLGPLKLFSNEKIDAAEIEKLKQSDALESAMQELAREFPGVREALIDERDKYLTSKIRSAPGETVVAVVGAGHVPGIKRYFSDDIDLAPLEIIPPGGKMGKIIGWGLPLVFIVLIVYGFFTAGSGATFEMAKAWIWITGLSAGIGSLLAFAHPLTVLTAVVSAPITTLHPLLASGWCAGLVEAILRKPRVADLDSVLDDIESVRGLWRNRLTHILLVIALTNLTGTIGAMLAMGKLAYFATLFGK